MDQGDENVFDGDTGTMNSDHVQDEEQDHYFLKKKKRERQQTK